MDLKPDELRSLGSLIERLNGDAFEIDAEVRVVDHVVRIPRFDPWTVDTITLTTPRGDLDAPPGSFRRRVTATLVRDPETLCFTVTEVK